MTVFALVILVVLTIASIATIVSHSSINSAFPVSSERVQ